jgi:UDP-N-acetylmuramate--alanine ligase
MDIYPANERPIDNINSTAILQEINKDFKRAVLINDKEELSAYLMKNIKNDDILLTMGAGDISKFVNYFKDFINR